MSRSRVHALRVFAARRIEECRRQEQKFWPLEFAGKRISTAPIAQAAIEATTERMTLQQVLTILDGLTNTSNSDT